MRIHLPVYYTSLFFYSVWLLILCTACQQRQQKQAFITSTTSQLNKTVEIRKTGKRYQFYRNGKPYFVKGASGRQRLDLVRAAGGNSIRTYSTSGLDTLLDRAQALDLSVAVGIYVGRELEGFDYKDKKAVRQQKEEIKKKVNLYKNHPAVLCWIVGNEPDIVSKNRNRLWSAINELIDSIHQWDPNHPVTVAVNTSSAYELLKRSPKIDFVAVNTFGHVADFEKNFKYDKPYLYTEWGSLGPWESKKTYWQAPLEETVPEKYIRIRDAYHYILKDTIHCLGSYVFYWGQKQEITPTWYSFFLENGAKTSLVDLMYDLWSKKSPENYAPKLDSFLINGSGSSLRKELQAGHTYKALINSKDIEHDPLQYHWEILPEGPFTVFQLDAGYVEVRPKSIPDVVIQNNGNELIFKTPTQSGAYRLFVQVFDGHGGGAYANMPFFVVNNQLTDHLYIKPTTYSSSKYK